MPAAPDPVVSTPAQSYQPWNADDAGDVAGWVSVDAHSGVTSPDTFATVISDFPSSGGSQT